MRRNAVTVSETLDYYLLSAEDAERSIVDSCRRPVVIERMKGTEHNTTVICDPEYIRSLMAYYSWNQLHPGNYLEDMSDISGQVFRQGDQTVIVPRFLLRQITDQRSKTSVTQTKEDREEALMQNALFNRHLIDSDYAFISDYGSLKVVGHCHSHPDLGGIGVSPSGTDVEEHNSHLAVDENKPWISQIVDPVRCLSAFYCGKHLKRPNVVLIMYEEDARRFHFGHNPLRKTPAKCRAQHVREVIGAETRPDVPAAADAQQAPFAEAAAAASEPAQELTGRAGKKHALAQKKACKMKLKDALAKHSSIEEINQIIDFINTL